MRILLAPLVLLAACATTDDPYRGGFFTGIQNIASGAYERRIAEREAEVEAARARTAELEGERAALSGQIAAAEAALEASRRDIVSMRFQLKDQGKTIPPEVEAKVVEVMTSDTEKEDPAERLAALRKSLADTRKLAEQLAQLSG